MASRGTARIFCIPNDPVLHIILFFVWLYAWGDVTVKWVFQTLITLLVAAGVSLGGGVANGPQHDGSEVDCDIPMEMRIRNTVGINGMGLCVFASMQMEASYQNIQELAGLFDYMKRQPGGGWPQKVDRIMQKLAPNVQYKQYQGDSLDFIQEGINSGRPVCVTMGTGELYGMRTIAHMVLCVGLDDKYAAILDNNDPQRIWWMERETFRQRFIHPNTSGWALYFLNPPPPPVPRLPDPK